MAILEIFLGIALIWIVLLILSSRKDLESKGFLIGPGLLIWQTTRLNELYEKISKRSKIFDRIGEGSVLLVLTLFIAFPVLLIINIIRAFSDYASPFLVPNPIRTLSFETVLLIIIPIILSLFIHELMHGVMAVHEGVEVKNSGIAVVIIFIAAFVQMVPESLATVSKKARMKITASGIAANLIIALILIPVLFVSSSLMTPLYHDPNGALITGVEEDTPADKAGLARGDIIKQIKKLQFGYTVDTRNITSANILIAVLRDITAGTEFILVLQGSEVTISGEVPPSGSQLISGSYLGIEVVDYRPPRINGLSNFLPYWVRLEIQWLINVNLILGLFNLLPLPLSDGGKILEELIEKYNLTNSNQERVKNISYVTAGILLVFNLLLTIF